MKNDDMKVSLQKELISFTDLSAEGYEVTFSNGYGASIIRHKDSLGGKKGLWEIAALKWSFLDGRNIAFGAVFH